MKITFIGGGVMGEAVLSAVLKAELTPPTAISVSDIDEARRRHLEHRYGMAVMNNNKLAADNSDVVVLAIKPQNLVEVMAELNGQLKPNQLVLSIVAGARIGSLCPGLNHNCVVRAMPNTPAQISEGISVWTAAAKVTEQQKEWVGSILGSMGKEIYVDDEKYIDMATAVSGSGPAYIFLFIESLIEAAVDIGLPNDMAKELVLQTVLGSGRFAQKSDKSLAELRRMVTSPGGTTAEALLQLEKGKFSELLMEAVRAAYNKAKKLGG